MDLFIFNRDLRLHDNPILSRYHNDNIMYACVYDGILDQNKHAYNFMIKAINDLEIIKMDNVVCEKYIIPYLTKIKTTYNIKRIGYNYNVYLHSTWKSIDKFCTKYNIELDNNPTSSCYISYNIGRSNGQPYVKFTPYYNVCKNNMTLDDHHPTYKKNKNNYKNNVRKDALNIFAQIKKGDFKNYGINRDFGCTTHLGPYISFGIVSISECINVMKDVSDELVRQMIWHDFYYLNYLTLEPLHKTTNLLKKQYKLDEWKAFKNAKTGYEFIDDGIHKLKKTGWCNNRQRMNIVMYAIHNIHIPFSKIEKWFATYMVDFIKSSNFGGVYWAYTQPKFKHFNYERQYALYNKQCIT